MPYIGNNLEVAFESYKAIDDIASSFNGSTTSFSLLVGGVAPTPFPKIPENCIISVGGVVQKPDESGSTGFKFTGTNIVFSSAPAAGEAFFGIILAGADYVNVGAHFPVGTLGAPSITFDGDEDTGIYRPAANTVAIVSGGTKVAQFPTTGGTADYVLISDGAGNLSWAEQSGGGATGAGTDKIFIENGQTVTTNYTIGDEFGAVCNAGSFGPITINSGVVVTIPTGESWTVI
jgi:hypothetical protein